MRLHQKKLDTRVMSTEFAPSCSSGMLQWIMSCATGALRGNVGGIAPTIRLSHVAGSLKSRAISTHGGNSLNNVANLLGMMAVSKCE